MSVHWSGHMFVASCPNCTWHTSSGNRAIADERLAGHRCGADNQEAPYRVRLREEWTR
jgi:hypothetical protein